MPQPMAGGNKVFTLSVCVYVCMCVCVGGGGGGGWGGVTKIVSGP